MSRMNRPLATRLAIVGSIVLTASCGTDSTSHDSTTAGPMDATVEATIGGPPTSLGTSHVTALYECFTAHGVETRDPAQPPYPVPAHAYPPSTATKIWGECRETYLAAVRESIAAYYSDITPELPADAAPLAYLDCMAKSGWLSPYGGAWAPIEGLADYTAANAACKLPVDGQSAEASYCRFLHAIEDRGMHDTAVSTTGVPTSGTDASRREAAVRLYDDAISIAPADLVSDLKTMRESLQQATEAPEAVTQRVFDHQLRVCGVGMVLGSLD
jgi:hypothetical protein